MRISIILLISGIVLILGWWFIGGIHLDYLKANALLELKERGFNPDRCIYEGYERSLISGFGGRVWYLCEKDNLYYEFALTRRINTPEIQVYNFKQITLFPSKFGVKIK